MPLTEREKRILEEIEQNLNSEDPAFARDIRQPWWHKFRQVKLGAGLFAGGFVSLLLGFLFNDRLVWFGVTAFAMMVLGVVLMSGATHDIARDQVRIRGIDRADVTERVSRTISTKVDQWEKKLRARYKRRP